MRCITLGCLLMALTSAPLWAEPISLGQGSQPRVLSDGKQQVSVLFGRPGEIWMADSIDGGASYSEPRAVVQAEGLRLGMRRGPRAALTNTSRVIAAIVSDKSDKNSGDVWAWTSTDGGKSFNRSASPLNRVPGAAREGLHALAASPDGNVVCVWLDLRNSEKDTAGMQIWMNQSSDGGVTWEGDRLLYREPSGSVCECCHPSVAMGPGNAVHVMFRNSRDGARDMYLLSSRDGGRTFAEPSKLGQGTWPLKGCPMDGGDVVVDADGSVNTAWMRDGRVFTTSGGKNEKDEGLGRQPLLLTSGNSRWVGWLEGRSFLSRVGAETPTQLSGSATFPTAALAGDQAVVAWEEKKEVLVDRVLVRAPAQEGADR